MSIVLYIIIALLMLTVLVVIHEWGHYFAGKRLGFTVEEFAIGFGPKIAKWGRKGTLFTLRCLPLGGFCRFYGEYDDEDDDPEAAAQKRLSNKGKAAFNKMPAWKRAIVFAAGPLMNLLFALILTVVILCAYGDYVPTVGLVYEGSGAQAAGLMEGDRVLRIDGQNVDFYTEIQLGRVQISGDAGELIEVVVERNGERLTYNAELSYNAEYDKNMIGIQYDVERVQFGFFEAWGLAFKWLYLNIVVILETLFGIIFRGQSAAGLTGIVGTIDIMVQVIRTGFENCLRVAAIISINLGIVNLFPIPALDGGKLVLLGVEKIRKKPLSQKVETYLNLAGFALLIVCFVLLTIQDVTRMVGG